MSRLAYPYLRPEPTVVEAEPWALLIGEDEHPVPDAIEDWDYNLDLRLQRGVDIDASAVREQCQLPRDASLAIAVIWRATGSGLFGRSAYEPLSAAGRSVHRLDVAISGEDVGGTLIVETVLVLAAPVYDAGELAPHRAGSVLWSDRVTTRLQGDASQFPIAIVDFGRTSLPEDAAWHLEISGSLDSAAMGSLLLLVNERNATVAEAFGRAARPRPVDKVVLSAVYADVARTLIEHALTWDEFVDGARFDDETLGAMLMDVFGQLFGGRTILDVRLRGQDAPSLVATEVQSAVRLFGGDL